MRALSLSLLSHPKAKAKAQEGGGELESLAFPAALGSAEGQGEKGP